MRDVEPDHRHRQAAPEHAPRSLRVDVDVELGRRRHVPFGDRAAHDHDALEGRRLLRVTGQKEGDVGQWADRDERDRPLGAEDVLGQEVDGVLRDRLALRLRERRPVEPGLAVNVVGDEELPGERPVGARGDGHVAPAHELEHAERVRGRLLERLVAGDGRDAEELELRAGEREQEGDRVVMARVAVEHDGRRLAHAARISSISAVVGSEGCAPALEAAIAPAAHAR